MPLTSLNILGIQVEAAIPEPLLAPLAVYGPHPALFRPVRHTVGLRLHAGRQLPGTDAFEIRTHAGQVQVSLDGGESVWIHGIHQDAQLQVGREHSVIELWTESGEADEALMVALTEVLRAQGILPLHAAVLERRGEALALFGASGTGKTTTMLAALQAGYRPVSEDYALYEPASGQVYGLDPGLRCLPDTLERVRAAFPLLTQPEVVRGKAFVSWEMLGRQQVWQAQWRAAAALRRDAARPSAELALPLAQRVMTLWAATGVPLLPAGREWTGTQITRLAQQLDWSERLLGSTRVTFGAS